MNNPITSTPKVSVIIPCYNQVQYLTEAIESVFRQSLTDYEIIIVNDGSTDDTKNVAESIVSSNPGMRVFLINQENQGLAAARNSGVRKSKGKYILPLDADDMIYPEMLQKTVSLLDSDSSIAIAYTDVIKFGVVDEKIQQMEYDFSKLLYQNHLVGSSLFCREVWEKVGGYNINMRWGYEDWDFWISCGEKGFYGKRIPEFLFMYRIKESSMLTEAFKKDKEIKAKIVLNHPTSYTNEEIEKAKHLLDSIKSNNVPKVSVVIPCYNHGQYLTEAVESVFKQTFTDYEIIIVNDGSTDDTKNVAESIISTNPEKQVFLINQKNQGVPLARNNGIGKSRGKYILPLDADDKIYPEMLQKTIDLLKSEPTIAIAYCDAIYFGKEDRRVITPEYDFSKLIYQNQLNYCSLYRKEAWESVGGYNINMRCGYEDWDFWISCGEKGFSAKRNPGFLFMYRVKDKSRYTELLKKDKELRARVFLNHPNLYKREEIDEASCIVDDIKLGELPLIKKEFIYKYEKDDLYTVLPNTHDHIKNLENALIRKDEKLKNKESHIKEFEETTSGPESVITDLKEISLKTRNGPLVSVILPTYNRPDMLKEALGSILSQTYKNIEIIVINDAGENVSEIIKLVNGEGKIVYLQHKENRGLAAVRNTGLKAARGKYIAYLDDDDVYYPKHIETLIGFLETDNYKVAYTDAYQASQIRIKDKYVTTEKKVTYSFDFDSNRLLVSNYIHIATIVHRKDLIDQVGDFDEGLDVHEDWEFFIRLSRYCNLFHIKVVTAEFRTREDGTNMTTGDLMPFLRTLRKIHSRYSHLVIDPKILEDQKLAEKSLNMKVEIRNEASCIIRYEQLHRYRFVTELVKSKIVLDVSCSDGYGSFLLSEVAKTVTGVDIDTKSIRRASSKYIRENLEFIKGSVTDIPIKGKKIFDAIICFGTLEHTVQHDELMREIKRLIKDDGIFIASIQNKCMCSDQPDYESLRSKRLYLDEFKAILSNKFKNTIIFGQKVFPSSNIFNLSGSGDSIKESAIEKGENEFLIVSPEKKEARCFIAVSSNSSINKDVAYNSHLLDISETIFKQKDKRIENLKTVLKDKDVHIGNLENVMKDKDARLENFENTIQNIKAVMKDKDTNIGNLETTIKDNDIFINKLKADIMEKDDALNRIFSSYSWQGLLLFYKIFPVNSWRSLFAKTVFNIFLKPRSVFEVLNKIKLKEKLKFVKNSINKHHAVHDIPILKNSDRQFKKDIRPTKKKPIIEIHNLETDREALRKKLEEKKKNLLNSIGYK